MSYFTLKVELNTDFSTYLSKDDPIVQEFNRVGETFGSNYLGMAIVKKDNIFTIENLEEIRDLASNYQEIDGVLRVLSIAEIAESSRNNKEKIEIKPLPKSEAELQDYQQYILEQEFFKGTFINDDASASVILISFDPDANHIEVANEIERVTNQLSPTPENVFFGGMPFLMSAFQTTIISNLLFLLPVMLLLLLTILFIGFRSLSGIFLPLLVVLISSIWLVGILSMFGVPLDMLTGIVPIILVAMGSADGIHLLRRYYELRNEGLLVSDAVKESTQEMGMPIVLTTITTMIGFASLATSNFTVIRQFGLVTTLGVFLALIVTFIFLPPIMSLTKDKADAKKKHKTKNHKLLDDLGDFIFHRRKTVVFVTGIVMVISLLGIPKIVSNVDWSLCFSKGSKPYEADMLLRDEFGGSLFAQVVVEGEIADPITLQVMKKTSKYMNTLPEVTQANSAADIFSEIYYRSTGQYTVPIDESSLGKIWDVLKEQESLSGIVDTKNKEFLISGKVSTMATADMSSSVNGIENYIENNSGSWVLISMADIASKESADELETKKAAQVKDYLRWDLEAEGITLNEAELQQIVETVIQPVIVDNKVKQKLTENVQTGLVTLMPESASQLPSGLVELIVETILLMDVNNQVSGNEILQAFSSVPQLSESFNKESAEYLAQAVNISTNEIAVERAYTKLEEIVPENISENQLLVKKLKGDLSDARSPYLVINENDFKSMQFSKQVKPEKEVTIELTQTGMVTVLKKMEDELTPTQIKSVGTALLVVVILLAIIFRSVGVGIIGVVPIILTVLVNFGVIGYLKIGLDSFTAMIASISIGLGIDYAIHFTSRFKKEFLQSVDLLKALKNTLQTTGVAIILNTVSVGIGFAVLLFAAGQHLQRFGGLLALALFVSAFFTLTILPALTIIFKPSYIRVEMAKGNTK